MSNISKISFVDALHSSELGKRFLLLGNGFSVSLFRDIFTYESLKEKADFSKIPRVRSIFEHINTNDFEEVLEYLQKFKTIIKLYNPTSTAIREARSDIASLKNVLVETIANHHPERPNDIKDHQYYSCRRFLSHFIGSNRKKDVGRVYSLNYDLLLYWVLLHEPDIKPIYDLKIDDGFREPEDELDATYVTWDARYSSKNQNVFYLHGALHLFNAGPELQKKCWRRAGEFPLIEQIRDALNEQKYPLFVAEGSANKKLSHIRRSGYLQRGERSFALVGTAKDSLFVFGHSLADSDKHILQMMEKSKISTIYISLYGNPDTSANKEVLWRAERIKNGRRAKTFRDDDLKIYWFNAEEAEVWS